MKTGYWQIRLVPGPNGLYITSFVTERGVFRWKVMPIWIQPASNELSHQMQHLFNEVFATEEIFARSLLVRDLDDFLGARRQRTVWLILWRSSCTAARLEEST